jgi:hypothetical protein
MPDHRASAGTQPAADEGKRRPGRGWRRIFHIHADRMGQKIPPLEALQDEIDKRVAAGESEEDVSLAVIEDFEKSAATVNARTTPLVPASGIVVTGAGILAKRGGEGDAATAVALIAMAFALIGLGFLATALVKKESNAQVGSVLTFLGFFILVIVIL